MIQLNKYFFIQLAIFICLHLFGATALITTSIIRLSLGNNTANFSLTDNLSNLASIYILQYAFISLILSFGYIFFSFKLTSYLNKRISNLKPYLTHILSAIIFTISLISVNSHFFQDTNFTLPAPFFIADNQLNLLWNLIIFLIPLLFLLLAIIALHTKIFILACLLASIYTFAPMPLSSSHTNKPNVFFISIDSLRPELIQHYMPFLNSQIEESAVFPNAYTPFARTYPSWTSILTGRHPVNHNARFNLQDESTLDHNNHYLAKILKQQGYQTIYASDERRFSNIGSTQGFETIIGPRTGASDFILGNYADLPITNLLTLLPISRWLTPELYANRAASHLYKPTQFSQLLKTQLSGFNSKPIFLATHFCLAHWPYKFIGHKTDPSYKAKPDYPDNLRHIDKQLKSLFDHLNDQGLLDNSRIVFLSDHGESWGQVDTGLKNKENVPLFVTDYGHGMNILSPSSHKVLIALKGFNIEENEYSRLSSLIDITPTVLSSLEIDAPQFNMDGHSLLKPQPDHIEISFESGLIVSGANTANPDTQKIAQSEAHRYNILKNGQLRLKPSKLEDMINSKQLALRINHQSIYRGRFSSDKNSFLIVDHSKNFYETKDSLKALINPYLKNSDITHLKNRFCQLYQNKHKDIKEECVNM